MADIDIDPFGEHESRTEEPTDENIPLTPVTPGRSTCEPEREQETSFGSPEVPLSRREILYKEYLVGEIYELISNSLGAVFYRGSKFQFCYLPLLEKV